MNKLLSIGQASKALGVTIQTLRNWDKKGLLKPDDMTKGGERRYKLETLKAINKNLVFNKDSLKTIAYARVSSHDQKDDLIRQVQVLELYCSKQGFNYEVIQDLGSGMNYYKKGLTKLLNQIKAFGCARLAYNWGLAKWQEYYKQGIKKSHLELKKSLML